MDDEVRLEGGKLVLFRRNGLWQARIAVGKASFLAALNEDSKQAAISGIVNSHWAEI